MMMFFKQLFRNSKKINLEKLLASNDINDSIIKIDNYISELCSWGHNLDRLTESQKNFYYNQSLEREINNGGFSQYFFNSSGDLSHETVNSLRVIGADKTADMLQAAINVFPDKKVPKNRKERQDTLENIKKIASEIWEELDQQFFCYEDNLNLLNLEYIRKNKESF